MRAVTFRSICKGEREDKMKCDEILMIGMVFLSIVDVARVAGIDANTFLSNKEVDVTAIATQAEQNYIDTCELVDSFQPSNCSRRECRPLLHEEGIACVSIINNTLCSGPDNSVCDSVRANLLMGYVRVPPLNLSFAGDIGSFLGSTICAQQQLDSTFRAINRNISSEPGAGYFYNLYFGDVQGAFRFYPGRELASSLCDTYDPRKRPWYIGAISIVKDLVVLIDTGYFMSIAVIANGNSTTPIAGAKAITEGLVYTLTVYDRITVIPFNENSLPKMANPPNLSVQYSNDPDSLNAQLQAFLDKLDTSDFSPSDSGLPSNYTTGFEQALNVFNSPGAEPSALKIVVLLTSIQNQALGADVQNLATRMFGNQSQTDPRLFVYELGANQSFVDDHEWRGIASEVGGYNEELNALDVITNPLASMYAYFGFQARSRRDYNQGRNVHFWQPRYLDASNLGWVMTAALPAYTAEGDLIGVAGLDLQTDGLSSELLYSINAIFTNDNTKETSSPTGANGANFSTNYGGFYEYAEHWNFCKGTTLTDNVFCTDDDFQADFSSLVCCGICAPGGGKSTGTWIAVGVACAVVIFLIVLIFFIVKKCWIVPNTNTVPEGDDTVHSFSYEELRLATNNFDERRIIGRGSFGVVYKTTLRGENVAVKMLHSQPGLRADDFHAEIKTSGIAHPNLVQLKGICSHSPNSLACQFFLVYELVEGGDLQSWLWPEENFGNGVLRRPRFLTWLQRKKIAIGAAKGLNYLHRGLLPSKQIFHLDIKPQNILLDRECNPKIADFGISQLYEPGHTYRVVTVRAATIGYCAPEVLDGPQPNSKLDVFSFGMVLLQLVSGRKVYDPDLPKQSLLPWARAQVKGGHADAEKVIDDRMIQEVREDGRTTAIGHCLQLTNLALRCLSVDPNERPEMSEVVDIINDLCADDQYKLESIRLDTVDLVTTNLDSSFQSGDKHSAGGLLKTISRSLARLSSRNPDSPRSGRPVDSPRSGRGIDSPRFGRHIDSRVDDDGNRSSMSLDSSRSTGQLYHTAADAASLKDTCSSIAKE